MRSEYVFWGGTGQAKVLREALPPDATLVALFDNDPSKINTLVQLAYVIAVVWQAAFANLPGWLVQGLGAGVLVTTVVSGVDYVMT